MNPRALTFPLPFRIAFSIEVTFWNWLIYWCLKLLKNGKKYPVFFNKNLKPQNFFDDHSNLAGSQLSFHDITANIQRVQIIGFGAVPMAGGPKQTAHH